MNCCNADMKKVILFNGVLFIYEGNYLKGLLGWLTNNEWMA